MRKEIGNRAVIGVGQIDNGDYKGAWLRGIWVRNKCILGAYHFGYCNIPTLFFFWLPKFFTIHIQGWEFTYHKAK